MYIHYIVERGPFCIQKIEFVSVLREVVENKSHHFALEFVKTWSPDLESIIGLMTRGIAVLRMKGLC